MVDETTTATFVTWTTIHYFETGVPGCVALWLRQRRRVSKPSCLHYLYTRFGVVPRRLYSTPAISLPTHTQLYACLLCYCFCVGQAWPLDSLLLCALSGLLCWLDKHGAAFIVPGLFIYLYCHVTYIQFLLCCLSVCACV